jgi:hypothetical protein
MQHALRHGSRLLRGGAAWQQLASHSGRHLQLLLLLLRQLLLRGGRLPALLLHWGLLAAVALEDLWRRRLGPYITPARAGVVH